MAEKIFRVLYNPLKMVISGGISSFGSSLTAFAIGVWAFQKTGSYHSYAMIGGAVLLPIVLISPIAGYVTDKYSRKAILIASDIASLLVVLTILAFHDAEALGASWLALSAFILAIATEFRFTSLGASLFSLCPKDKLVGLNGVQQLFRGINLSLAPVIAATLLHAADLKLLLAIDVATYLLNIAIVFSLPIRSPSEKSTVKQKFWTEFSSGARLVAQSKKMRSLLLFFTTVTTLISVFNIALPPYVLSNWNSTLLGLISAALGMGILLGGVIVSRYGTHETTSQMMVYAAYGLAIAIFTIGFAQNALIIGALTFVAGLSIAALNAANQALWQQDIPNGAQGKVLAVRSMITYSMSPIAITLSVPLVQGVGGSSPHAAIGVVISAIGGLLMTFLLFENCQSRSVRKRD